MNRRARRYALLLTLTAGVLAVAVPAWAYYAFQTTAGTATVTAGALGTPVTGTPTATPTSVTFTVAPGSGVTPAGFRVDRTAPTSSPSVCTFGTSSGGTCTDSAPVVGQTNTYLVYALLATSWASLSPATVSIAVPATAPSYSVSPATSTPTAGTAFNVTITAKAGAATDTSYSGSKTLDWSGGLTIGAFAPAYPATGTFTNGVATVSVTLYKAGAQTLTVTDHNATGYTGSAAVTVSAAQPVLSFTNCQATFVKNSAFSTAVSRTGSDPYGNSTGTAALTVTLAPYVAGGSNANFTSPSVSFAAGGLTSGSATYETANGVATSTFTGSATGYVTASCTVTTT